MQQRVSGALEAYGIEGEQLPDEANASGMVAAPALYGLAAIEAIPADVILERADPQDLNGDGISGRAGRTAEGRVGRFGRKAVFDSLPRLVAAELSNQMGLTTPTFPAEQNVAGAVLPPGTDPAKDPEIGTALVDSLTNFIRLLAFPVALTPRAARDSVRQGEELFQQIGCAACHAPALSTGRSAVRGLRGKSVPLYSDLLLHDLGPGLAGACAPGVQPGEWRTAPLFGLRLRPQLMHDGRVQTIESAVDLHGGEAESSRALFEYTLTSGAGTAAALPALTLIRSLLPEAHLYVRFAPAQGRPIFRPMGGIALFMIVTALVVLFPVLLQLRQGESRLREVWGYLVFILGLLLIALGDTNAARAHQALLTGAGVLASLIGLIAQSRNPNAMGPHQQS